MDKSIKTKWIKALRDGGYIQGEGMLRNSDMNGITYCCLGVLCDIEGLEYGEEGYRFDEDWDHGEPLNGYFGLDVDTLHDLMCMNDGSDEYQDNSQSFEQIADYIEENL